jgi:hypothetical protein
MAASATGGRTWKEGVFIGATFGSCITLFVVLLAAYLTLFGLPKRSR